MSNELLLKTGLYKKISLVMDQVGKLPKDGYNEFHKYKYTTESAITDGIRHILAKEGLIILNTVKSSEVEGQLTTVVMEFKIVCVDTGQSEISVMVGQGLDKGDKGFYKAYTGALKYFLMKTFLIPTGDDPEADSGRDIKGYESRNENQKQPDDVKKLLSDGQLKKIQAMLNTATKAINGTREDHEKITKNDVENRLKREIKEYKDLAELPMSDANQFIKSLQGWIDGYKEKKEEAQ